MRAIPSGKPTTKWPSQTREINRPQDEYGVVIDIVKMEINKGVTDDKFVLEQPPGTTLRVLGQPPAAPASQTPARPLNERRSPSDRQIVLENLKNRPMRSLLSILLIGVPVTLILTLVGLTQGMLTDSQNRQRGVGADIIIRGSTVSSVISFSGASIPAGVADKVQQQPHVKLAMGVINHPVDLPCSSPAWTWRSLRK